MGECPTFNREVAGSIPVFEPIIIIKGNKMKNKNAQFSRTMENLKGTHVSYYEVDYGVFENLVMKTYGISDYSFVADIECGNDSSHDYSISEGETLDDWGRNKLKEFIDTDGKKIYMARTLMIDMYNKGLIGYGDYLIQVSW